MKPYMLSFLVDAPSLLLGIVLGVAVTVIFVTVLKLISSLWW